MQAERALTYVCIRIRRDPIPSCRRSYHSISLSNMPSNTSYRTVFACASPKTIQEDRKAPSTIDAHPPRPANAVHHFATPWSVSSAFAVPAPNFVKTEKIFPKKMAAIGLKRAEASVERIAIVIATPCCRVVKIKKERHEYLTATLSAVLQGRSSWFEAGIGNRSICRLRSRRSFA